MATGIGKKIKYYRIKAKMTQEELANGIVSVSYLSKIEHNTAAPNIEAIKLICDKLQIKPVCTDDEQILIVCNRWFTELLYGNLATAHKTYQQISEEFEKVIDSDLYCLVELHTLQFYLLTNQIENAKIQYEKLARYEHSLSELEFYYWNKFSGCFHIENSAYSLGLEKFQNAEKLIKSEIHNYQYELHDLYYRIAKVTTDLYFTYHAMTYANKALKYYRNNYLLKNCAKCHILTGIGYQRMREIEKSKKSFQLAITIADEQDEQGLLAECQHYLGVLYKRKLQPVQALHCFNQSYQLVKNTLSQEELVATINLMKEYVDQNDLDQAIIWYERAVNMAKKMKTNKSVLVYEIKVYKYLIYGFTPSFETLMQKEVLPFLKERELYIEYGLYLKKMGEYYYKERKYKVAADYFEEAFQSVDQIRRKDSNSLLLQ
ncbi:MULTISPECIES: helix-turn-helix domain-containing protein [Paraliobacillus]|uniref:helix-turn-helix domain-containing protein n=1 Tax=Paraliobacillus TaxID=200903 RepID=UPI000DD47C74|nr:MULTISPECIES: helix-turn-helix transcriptional regulator [Paraliobacillus]